MACVFIAAASIKTRHRVQKLTKEQLFSFSGKLFCHKRKDGRLSPGRELTPVTSFDTCLLPTLLVIGHRGPGISKNSNHWL